MKSWNWRVVVENIDGNIVATLREVYYDEEGNIEGWSEKIAPMGFAEEQHDSDIEYWDEAERNLREDLNMMYAAFDKSYLLLREGELVEADV